MMLRVVPIFLLCCASLTAAFAQPTPCPTELGDIYEGPCYYGALPAFFDDFEYDAARTTGRIADASEGSLFGSNGWTIRDGVEQTRAWYRFNRNDLPVPGTITFGEPSVMAMRLPAGLAASDFPRSLIIHAGFTGGAGTYHWRVRLSESWSGQRLRQSIWTMSHNTFVFERQTPTDTTRYSFWSELDFENENHIQGERRDGVFVPDYVTRMSVGNHYGKLESRRGDRRLGREGPTDWEEGRGKLARDGPGRGAAAEEAPLVETWADAWLHLVIELDSTAQTATYRMIPEDPEGPLRVLADHAFTAEAPFYPLYAMHPAFSLHWVEPEGRLRHPFSLEVDWVYYTPTLGLSDDEVLRQVDHLRQQDLARVNTTGRATFQPYDETQPLGLRIEGPRQVACGEEATWLVRVTRIGRYHLTYRYRLLRADGTPEPWQEVFEPTVTTTPRRGQAGVELEATAQDRWTPHGIVKGPNDWEYPNPDNDTDRVRLTATFDCEVP